MTPYASSAALIGGHSLDVDSPSRTAAIRATWISGFRSL
jgi:hypothetical protein